MTPTGYMTEDAWVELAPSMAAGIRQLPIICEAPDWWVVKFVDGFGPHVSSIVAMQETLTVNARILVACGKERIHSGDVCCWQLLVGGWGRGDHKVRCIAHAANSLRNHDCA